MRAPHLSSLALVVAIQLQLDNYDDTILDYRKNHFYKKTNKYIDLISLEIKELINILNVPDKRLIALIY